MGNRQQNKSPTNKKKFSIYFGSDKQFFSFDFPTADPLMDDIADCSFVHITVCSVDMAIASFQCTVYSILYVLF